MSGIWILIIMIGACAIGYFLNSSYENIYHEPAINWGMLAIQAFFILCALITWPNPDVTVWFVIWCILTIISYIIAFIVCKQHAKQQNAARPDVNKAIAAQMILPIGTAIVVLLIIAMVLGAFGGGKKKK